MRSPLSCKFQAGTSSREVDGGISAEAQALECLKGSAGLSVNERIDAGEYWSKDSSKNAAEDVLDLWDFVACLLLPRQ